MDFENLPKRLINAPLNSPVFANRRLITVNTFSGVCLFVWGFTSHSKNFALIWSFYYIKYKLKHLLQ